MLTKDFYYDLPKELIAQTPAEDRSSCRLLVYDRGTREITDTVFRDIVRYLHPGDILVRNNTKVMPARLYAVREDNGAKAEFLLLERVNGDTWKCIARPARRIRPGYLYRVNGELSVRIVGDADMEGGKTVELLYDGIFEEILDRAGNMPLPPYIKEKLKDPSNYQTVYAKELGSAAAPTAGLHFTEDLFRQIRENRVEVADILLHVGLGTFRPVSAGRVEDHVMHSEYYEVSKDAADAINRAKVNGGRRIAVGTTSVRTLESVADEDGRISAKTGWTSIFIKPGYRFRAVDALITNFHLPESTLLMLVSAMCSREEILRVYQHAIEERYRFFSFGDAMLIL